MNWFRKLFNLNDQIEVTVNGVNPQTENEFRFFNFVEQESTIRLEGWYDKTKELGYSFRPQYVEAIKQKLKTGKFKNPYTFPEYFESKFDYIAIDFETANNNRVSACAIGLAFVKNDTIVHYDNYFIQPPKGEKLLNSHSRIHGIYKEDIEFALDFDELWKHEFSKYFNNNLIIFHNASMDLSVLKNLFKHYKIRDFNIDYIDTMNLAERTGNPKKLAELANQFGIEFENKHDPREDAEVCAKVFSEMIDQYPNYLELIQNLSDKIIDKNESVKNVSIKVQNENINIIKEYSLTREELTCLSIKGNGFLFTGELDEERADCKAFIIENGGFIKPSITSKVDYTVVGSGYGWSKIQKIHELNTVKNCNIKILTNNDFQFIYKKYSKS